ncbi:MAG: hypothetical protein UZ22_OP11002000243 [Microgenomates bacterium OLB23]|nr:MAG: hypothetical protein UZ22_OP11002000243 [Microgenomates bacterium OLB23]
MYLVVNDAEAREKVMHLLGAHLVYLKEPQYNLTDRMALWLTSLMPDGEEPRVDPSKTGV